MGLILRNLMGMTDIKLNDQIIALSTDLAMKSAANTYLAANLRATTPEVRQFIAGLLTQKVTAHDSLTALILKKDWAQPYISPTEQMSHANQQSSWVLNQEQQHK
ncbi:coat F domain-containing protein [Clostridium aceticum]|uniref:Coat F domain-containing protein n=1 Tax=Clostridium aceticum TaxID=84022 RepID=A0A0G3W9U9_9CLOT|nr:spore coat protein [Clostridium aceticum]AKL94677.1 coat F domain-containing protein [Clostridium aceticum]